MKALFFYASAAHPKVALALMNQAGATIRPFSRYLGQAIHTAKQRQFRYQLPWEKVRNLVNVHLEPIDTWLRVPRRQPRTVLIDWPQNNVPDTSQPGFVINRGLPFHVSLALATDTGLSVRTNIPLQPTDTVVWCMQQSRVQQEEVTPPPRDLRDVQGKPLRLVVPPRADQESHWLVLVEGAFDDSDLLADGDEVEVEVLHALTDVRKVFDTRGRAFDVQGGTLRVEELPADGPLRDELGTRYHWSTGESSGRRGCWVQLLPPDSGDAEDFMDPRAAFCEGDLDAVWTEPRHRKDTTFKVKKVDQDRYQLLLDRYPPERTTLYLPVDGRNLQLQKRALRQLAEAPLPHHQGLLRLCENPDFVSWPNVTPGVVSKWHELKDSSRSGTDEQQQFVVKALGTSDFAFLQGPPGSGKTTAICEIVQQLVQDGQRVLLCASTHVAIDNVLERLLDSDSRLYAVRIGKLDKVDDKVQATQLDERIERLLSDWRNDPSMSAFGDAELAEMAERTIIMAANLTCGTTMGIISHPLFRGRDEDLHRAERPISTMPHWDVLIVDEASKTLIQEFFVPALMAKRWIIVGDVRQLPPFNDRNDIVANLRDLVDENNKPVFPPDHQRACLLLFRLLRAQVRQPGMRWLIVERPGVLEWIARELDVEPVDGLLVVRVARGGGLSKNVDLVTVDQLRSGKPDVLKLAAANWVLVGDDLLGDVVHWLPSNLLFAEDLEKAAGLEPGNMLLMRQAWWLAQTGALPRSYKEKKFRRDDVATVVDSEACESDWLRRNDLATELTWRLTRLHELRHSHNDSERKRLRKDLDRLRPRAVDISEPIAEIEDIGLPSIIEVLQEGIGVDRAKRRSALTTGMQNTRPNDFNARFESLTYQHRMHDDIASFSRENIYRGQALKNANTIEQRDAKIGWDFGPFRARRMWAHIEGSEKAGVNEAEIRVIRNALTDFIAWVKRKGSPPRNLPKFWEVACLCFYVKQEGAIAEMLRDLTGDARKTRFQVRGAPIEIVCGTVDRFQGREADIVFLSMRNTRRVGFLDSPNRLNVALTRARQQLFIVGNHHYFADCGISELTTLATRTHLVAENEIRRWRRRSP